MKSLVRYKQATGPDDFTRIARLADSIWKEHYTPIIGEAQVAYMLEHFQSGEAIARQVADGMIYFLIQEGDTPLGYLAIQKRGRELFLSKIYLLREYRGLGTGKRAMDFIAQQARDLGCDRIALTVNKNNDLSIKAYARMGFENKGTLVTDIGGGFVMDDYLMVSILRNRSSDAAGSSPV